MTTARPPAAPEDAPTVAPNFITEIIERDLSQGRYAQIVTRFPPEPSGYPHLGHVFASFLDFQTARQYGGRYHLRMDDSNPELARQEFVDVIAEDLRWLGWDWGTHFYYASDYFEQYYQQAERLIQQGDAYVDSVSADEMARLRGDSRTPGQPSPFRERGVPENLELFRRMRAGEFPDGAHVLRAKIDLGSPNLKLRDPVLYRILHAEHYRTARQWCIYPMYDFQHPLQDALEGVTHSMCSLEFIDNRAIYDWLMEKLDFNPRPHQYEFGRRGLEYTMTSKRKLRRLVQEGKVSGWDDPRMPTLRAQRRLGVTPEAIRNFAAQIGVSRTNRTVDLSVYENAIRDDLNHRAPRVMAVLEPLRVTISNLEAAKPLRLPYWPHDMVSESKDGLVPLPDGQRVPPEQAVREVTLSRELYIEREDFRTDPPKGFKRLVPGGTVRLRGAGIIRADSFDTDETGQITRVHATLLDDQAKASGVIHWVSAEEAISAEFRLYDRLFRVPNPEGADPSELPDDDTSAPDDAAYLRFLTPGSLQVRRGFVERSVLNDPADTRYQFERQGYFWRDPVDSREDALVFGRIITLKDAWGKRVEETVTVTEKHHAEKLKVRHPIETEKVSVGEEIPFVEKLKALTPQQEQEVRRLVTLGAAEADARTIVRDAALLDFVRGADPGANFGQVASWTVNELAAPLRSGAVKLKASALAPLAELLAQGKLTSRVVKDVLARAVQSGEAPLELVQREGLDQGLSVEHLREAIQTVLNAHPDEVAAYRSGKTALLGFFTGQVMRATAGKADPKLLAQELRAALS